MAEDRKGDSTNKDIEPHTWKPWLLSNERYCNPPHWKFSILKKQSFSFDPMRNMISKYWNQPQMKENVQGDGQKADDEWLKKDQGAANGEKSKELENRPEETRNKKPDGVTEMSCEKNESRGVLEDREHPEVLSPQMKGSVQGDGQKADDESLKINNADTNGEKSKELENRREETRKETPDGVTGMSCKKNKSRGVLEDRKHPEVLSVNEIQDLQEKVPEGQIKILWIGHASLLIQMDGVNILTDPIFSNKAGPKNMVGYSRYREPAVTVAKLKEHHIEIDAVIISHNHYDHFDKQSIRDLHYAFPTIEWFVPMKLKSDLTSLGCEDKSVHEATWWQPLSLKSDEGITFHFTPAKHWSGRNPTDWYTSLWGSWIIEGKTATVFFAGDTGFEEELFTAIKKKFNRITVAALPIGAYEPREMMKCQHINPEEAVQIHNILGAKKSIGIHWRTFQLSCEGIDQPSHDLEKAKKDQKVNKDDFITLEKSLITTIDCNEDSSQPQSLHTPD